MVVQGSTLQDKQMVNCTNYETIETFASADIIRLRNEYKGERTLVGGQQAGSLSNLKMHFRKESNFIDDV